MMIERRIVDVRQRIADIGAEDRAEAHIEGGLRFPQDLDIAFAEAVHLTTISPAAR